MKNKLVYFIFFLQLGCQTKQVLVAPSGPLSDSLFPDGIYYQHVLVQVHQPTERSFEFDAVMKKSNAQLNMYSYNAFGVTLLTVRSKSSEDCELETNIDQIAQHKEFFLQFFPLVRKVIYANLDELKNLKPQIEKEFQANAVLNFDESSKIPRSISLEATGRYQVLITNRKYTP